MKHTIVPVVLGAVLLSACSNMNSKPAVPTTAAAEPYVSTYTPIGTEYSVPNQLLFATDSAEVLPAGHKILAAIAGQVKLKGAAPIEVNGYADTTGRKVHNQKLSEERAAAVAAELATNGIEASRIKSQGFGESELAVPTADSVDEAKNRRVVVRVANN
jgi:outer membrane protein OmpA-like peptidoglycan-associated protein